MAECAESSSDEGVPALAVAVAVPVPSAPPLAEEGNIVYDDDEEEARATANAARDEGIAAIRHHCENHLSCNPQSTYVTWIATLHPENAEVVIDPRFLIDGNPWLVVYEQTKDDLQKGRISPETSAVAEVSINGGRGGEGNQQVDSETTTTTKKCKCGGGMLDFAIGCSLVLSSVCASLAIELAGSYCYLSYWLCHQIMRCCTPSTMLTCLPFCMAFFLGKVFKLLDAVLLLTSIIVVECIGGTNYVLCTILACDHDQGRAMHQMTRRLPHLVRWAFRQKFAKWNPPRTEFRWLHSAEN